MGVSYTSVDTVERLSPLGMKSALTVTRTTLPSSRLNDSREAEQFRPMKLRVLRYSNRYIQPNQPNGYQFQNRLFRFWFRFVSGNEDRYERLRSQAYEAIIEPELPDFVSHNFETVCQNALPRLYPDEMFLDIGRGGTESTRSTL
nr:DUF234 domain-containing protein [Natronosalvus vescus]